jgi:hypothetical protein
MKPNLVKSVPVTSFNLNLHFLPEAEQYPAASCGKRSSDDIPASEESIEHALEALRPGHGHGVRGNNHTHPQRSQYQRQSLLNDQNRQGQLHRTLPLTNLLYHQGPVEEVRTKCSTHPEDPRALHSGEISLYSSEIAGSVRQ